MCSTKPPHPPRYHVPNTKNERGTFLQKGTRYLTAEFWPYRQSVFPSEAMGKGGFEKALRAFSIRGPSWSRTSDLTLIRGAL